MAELNEHTTAGRMHVLRHHFEPSAQLSESLRTFIGPSLRPGFLLRSTKEVYVDSVAYTRGRYHDQDLEAQRVINETKRTPFYIARMALKSIFSNPQHAKVEGAVPAAYRLAFLPEDEDNFARLAASLDVYPRAMPTPGLARHYLYLDVRGTALMGRNDIAEETAALRSTIEKGLEGRLFSAAILDLRGIEVPVRRIEPAQEPEAVA